MSCKKFCERKQLYSPWNSPGQNNGVGSLSLLQGLCPTQGSNPGLPHCRQILYQLSHKGSLRILEWVKWSEVKSLSRVRFFATPWTVAYQAPPSMGFSRQEYWSGLPFPSPGDLPNPGIERGSPALQTGALLSEPPGKPQATGMGSLSLLQGIFLTQELNLGSPALQVDSSPTELSEKPKESNRYYNKGRQGVGVSGLF